MMNNNTQMEELSVFQLLSRYNFIVPEIQREYVWGKKYNDEILGAFYKELVERNDNTIQNSEQEYQAFKTQIDESLIKRDTLNFIEELQSALNDLESRISTNIGFLYSYRPGYYVNNDISEDVYLIDGQQRFTTLVLSIFFFALKEDEFNDNKKCSEKFCDIFKVTFNTDKIAFDYRVRNITHHFVLDLIKNVKKLSDLKAVEGKNWFLTTYSNDESVKAMLGTINKLFSVFGQGEELLFNFLLTKVKFWHFKTEETSQGEELYITMNSRGKALSKNEILRAKLFKNVDSSTVQMWGGKWERWQDFFWENKEKNGNADIGFNEFLRWVQVLEMVNNATIDTISDDDDSNDKKLITETLKWEKREFQELNDKYITLKSIDKYFEVVVFIFKNLPSSFSDLKIKYPTYFRNNLISMFWLKPPKRRVGNENEFVNTISQLDSFKLLPLIEYCKIRKELGENIEPQQLYRFSSYLYNLSRQSTVTKGINAACINAIKIANEIAHISEDIAQIVNVKRVSTTLLTQEEKFKFQLYLHNSTSNLRENIEQLFWKAEDLKLNNGRIIHLIQASYFTDNSIQSYVFEKDFKNYLLTDFDFSSFSNWLEKYIHLTNGSNQNIPERVWGNLLQTTYYWEQPYGSYKSIVCNASDDYCIKSREFLKMVIDLDITRSQQQYLSKLEHDYFLNYSTIDDIIKEADPKRQLFIFFVLIYKKDSEFFRNKGRNFVLYNNPPYLNSLFDIKYRFEHFSERWGGAEWRYLVSDRNDVKYLASLLDGTFWQ